jgi:hypothetical protein
MRKIPQIIISHLGGEMVVTIFVCLSGLAMLSL